MNTSNRNPCSRSYKLIRGNLGHDLLQLSRLLCYRLNHANGPPTHQKVNSSWGMVTRHSRQYFILCEIWKSWDRIPGRFASSSPLCRVDWYIIANVSEELAASFRIFCSECSKVGLTFQYLLFIHCNILYYYYVLPICWIRGFVRETQHT
jgi:hypothetical protein